MADSVQIQEENPVEEKPIVICKGINGETKYQIQEFQEYIKKHFEACNINFLIGAGYSYEKLYTLGNLEELIEENVEKNALEPEKLKAIEGLILYDFFNQSIYDHKSDIEDMTSFENSDRFIQMLVNVLNSRNDKSLLSRANIFTSNYDMYIELSLEKSGVHYNDGFAGRMQPKFSCVNYNRITKQIVQNTERESLIPQINLFKFHGSLTWDKNEDYISYRQYVPDLLDEIKNVGSIFKHEDFDYIEKTSDNQSNLEEAIDTINSNGLSDQDIFSEGVNEFIVNYRKLFIVNPTKKKFEETLFSNVYYDLLRMYSNELEKSNSLLIVFGFSFRDEHIREITKRAVMNPSLIMYIFIFEKSELGRYENIFAGLNNVFFVYYEDEFITLPKFTELVFG